MMDVENKQRVCIKGCANCSEDTMTVTLWYQFNKCPVKKKSMQKPSAGIAEISEVSLY